MAKKVNDFFQNVDSLQGFYKERDVDSVIYLRYILYKDPIFFVSDISMFNDMSYGLNWLRVDVNGRTTLLFFEGIWCLVSIWFRWSVSIL